MIQSSLRQDIKAALILLIYAAQLKGSAPSLSGAVEFRSYATAAAQEDLAKSILATVRLK